MTRNIDDLTEGRWKSPSDKLKESFLNSRPRSQWPPYLDETAKDLATGIAIADTKLDKYNFPREVGSLYCDGLLATVGDNSHLHETLQSVDEDDLGRAMFLLNRLEYQIKQSDTGLENTPRAVTAVLETTLAHTGESTRTPDLDQVRGSTSNILLQLLTDPAVARRIDKVFDAFEDAYHSGLLATLDEPQMTTQLWNHQREAIKRWLRADSRGYVDMATATGKTVLGLAAIAAHYGSLHPMDSDIDRETSNTDTKVNVLVVAHNDLILEQWRREFDRHLNIPPDRTQGSNDVDLSWGRIHFNTAQTLLNQDFINYDLVILDEAHHYASGTGWGKLLDKFDNKVLALSGSVDTEGVESSMVRDRLESNIGPECKRYTLVEAQADGIVPTFEWAIEYTGTGYDEEFVDITKKAQVQFERFQERLRNGELTVKEDRRLRTFQDIRRFSHTSEGESLKQADEQFRDLVTTLFSRQTQLWNQSPDPTTIVTVVERYLDQHVVVFTNNNAQVEAVAETLREHSDVADATTIYTVSSSQSSEEQRDTIDKFDDRDEPAILVGTGNLLGEGVDMQHAEVGINMATGSVNKQLVQRIGRVLRDPGEDSTARFINLVGIPVDSNVQIPAEDGKRLIEDAARFMMFGDSFDNDPAFRIADGVNTTGVKRLLDHGYDRITSLKDERVYQWPDDESEGRVIEEFLQAIDQHPGAVEIVSDWGAIIQSSTAQGSSSVTDRLVCTVVTEDEDPIKGVFVSFAGDDVAYGRTDSRGRIELEEVSGSGLLGVRTPDGSTRSLRIDLEDETDRSLCRPITVPSGTDHSNEVDG